MGIFDCIDNSFAKDALKKELKEAIEQRIKEMPDTMAGNFKATVALREITDAAAEQTRHRKRLEHLKIMALQDAINRMDLVDGDPARGLETLYRADLGGNRQEADVSILVDSIIGENTSLTPSLSELRPKIFSMTIGVQKKYNADIRRAGMGIKTENKIANQIAKEMQTAINSLVDMYRAAGGNLRKLDGWFLPQNWNMFKVAKVQKDNWVNETLGTIPEGFEGAGKDIIDRTRMTDQLNESQLTEGELRDVVDYSYDTISTDGLNKWDEGGRARKGFANKRDNARVLHFTPEGWLYMNKKYGDEDTVSAFLRYRDGLANDIAIMQVLGPNPDWLLDKVSAVLTKKMGSAENASPKLNKLQRFHNLATGRATPIDNHRVATANDAIKSGTTSTLLGASFFPTLGDWSTSAVNNVIAKTRMADRIGAYVKLMANSKDSVERAMDDMIVIDTILSANAALSKNDGLGTRTSSVLSRATQGLLEKGLVIPSTNANRVGAMKSHMFKLGRDLGKSFDQLQPERKALFKTYGITQEMWDDVVTKTKPELVQNWWVDAKQIDFVALREADPDVFRRVHRMVIQEGRQSVLTTDLGTEDALNRTFGNPDRGTFQALWKDQLKLYKRFSFSAARNIISVARNENTSAATKAKALGVFAVSTMFMGATAMQLRQIIQGKDLLPMTDDDGVPDWRFWTSAAIYGGFMPLIADVYLEALFGASDPLNPRGGGSRNFVDFFPTARIVRDVAEPWVDAGAKVFEGDVEGATETVLGDGIASAGKFVAGVIGGNHFAIKTALERYLWNPWEQFFDPDGFEDRTDRTERYLEQRGQGFFFRPGDLAPERAPEIGEPQER